SRRDQSCERHHRRLPADANPWQRRQRARELRGKLRQLRFESRSNFAIVHRVTPPWWFGFLVKTLLPRISSPPTSQSRQATDLSRVRLSVLQILGKLLEIETFERSPIDHIFHTPSSRCGGGTSAGTSARAT